MFAKSKISFTVDHVFEKNATHQFVSDVRSNGHLNITELPNQKQVSLKKLKKIWQFIVSRLRQSRRWHFSCF